MTQPDLSIVIVNWNTRELLAQCLRSVYREASRDVSSPKPLILDTIVVDNASQDGSSEMIRGDFPQVRLLESGGNLGFAAGNNIALREVAADNILLLNPDTVVTEGVFTELLRVIHTHAHAGIVGAQLLNSDGTLQRSFGAYPSVWSEVPLLNIWASRHRLRYHSGDRPPPSVSVDWVSGACFLILRHVVDEIGPLDESFWLYTEEADWCYRARKAGWDVLLAPTARVYHLARQASRQRFVQANLHFYLSRIRFVHKHHSPRQARWLRDVLRMKSAIWRLLPGSSPLCAAYPNLAYEQIRDAYRRLSDVLGLPVDVLLAQSWQ